MEETEHLTSSGISRKMQSSRPFQCVLGGGSQYQRRGGHTASRCDFCGTANRLYVLGFTHGEFENVERDCVISVCGVEGFQNQNHNSTELQKNSWQQRNIILFLSRILLEHSFSLSRTYGISVHACSLLPSHPYRNK